MIKRIATVLLISTVAISAPSIGQTIMVGPDATYSESSKPIVDQLKSAASVSNISVQAAEEGYPQGTALVKLDVTNLTDKTLAGIRVYSQSFDVFNKILDGYGLETDKNVNPNETITLEGRYGLRSTLKAEQSKVKYYAQPIHIVFEDGTELKDPRFQ